MKLNKVDKKTVKDFLPFWGIEKDEAIAEYKKAKKKAISQFGKESDKKTAARAVQIASVVLRPKSYNLGSGKKYNAIIAAVSKPRDMWSKIRARQLKKYEEMKKQGKQKQAFADKIVKLDESTGNIIPLCPALKSDGTPSKVAGEPIPSPEDAAIQAAMGITYIEEGGKRKPVGFSGSIQGRNCVTSVLDRDTVYEFSATGAMNKKTGKLNLNINTHPRETQDKFLLEGVEKMGLTGMLEKMFSDIAVDQPTVASFAEEGSVPKKYRDFMIIKDVMIPYISPTKSDKGNITIEFEQKIDLDNPPSEDAKSVRGIVDSNTTAIDFGQGTEAMIIGNAWIPTPDEGEEPRTIMNVDAIIPYLDGLIDPAPEDTQEISEDEVDEAEEDEEEAETSEADEEDDDDVWA